MGGYYAHQRHRQKHCEQVRPNIAECRSDGERETRSRERPFPKEVSKAVDVKKCRDNGGKGPRQSESDQKGKVVGGKCVVSDPWQT